VNIFVFFSGCTIHDVNDRIEGINNKIKVLNRVAYGYRNFSNFKNRIMLHCKLKPVGRKMGQEYNETHPHGANVHKDVCLILYYMSLLERMPSDSCRNSTCPKIPISTLYGLE